MKLTHPKNAVLHTVLVTVTALFPQVWNFIASLDPSVIPALHLPPSAQVVLAAIVAVAARTKPSQVVTPPADAPPAS